jgi:peptidoglycan/LPS O-acetylase OafA/YrhL
MVQYRRDVDGLRALAIGAVLFFHAFPSRMPGGFVGVDVFFVISGYLISLIIFDGLERGNFTFFKFFSRRVRRLAPALVVVLSACLALGWFILLANEYKHLGRNIFSSAFFIINFDFLNEINYFEDAADIRPLLHLWSLGIEAQFYIAWCFLIWLIWKFRINSIKVILYTTLASLAWSVVLGILNNPSAFYLPQTRFWELLLGSHLAWYELYKKTKYYEIPNILKQNFWDSRLKHVDFYKKFLSPDKLSAIGLLFLFISFFLISKDRAFPSFWALIPTLGTFLIILAGPNAFLNKNVFSNKIVVWFGLVSYPLYLWHWPLLSFARIIESETPRPEIRAGILVISIFFAWLTYRFVEVPVRNRKHGQKKTAVLLVLLLVIGCFGYSCYVNEGYRQRSNASINGFYGNTGTLDWYQYITKNYYACDSKEIALNALVWKGFVRCAQSKPGPDVQVALVGDSHAEHLFIAFAESFPGMNIASYMKGTPPFLSNKDFNQIFKTIQTSASIKYIILSSYWIQRVEELSEINSNLTHELIRVIDLLERSGKRVYITEDMPAFNFGPEKCVIKRWAQTSESMCHDARSKFEEQKKSYLNFLILATEQRPKAKLIRLNDLLCEANTCSMMINGDLMYRDSNHLSIQGSHLLGRGIRQKYPNLFD